VAELTAAAAPHNQVSVYDCWLGGGGGGGGLAVGSGVVEWRPGPEGVESEAKVGQGVR
jgi:hypothetical protein